MNEYFDSHCHLDSEPFAEDREEALQRAQAAGVRQMAVIGMADRTSAAPAARAIDLARTADGIYATVGVHPHDACGSWRDYWSELAQLATDPNVVAIGESGLDYYYKHSSPPAQEEAFAAHLELAETLGKPIVCHIRDAHVDAARILEAAAPSLPPIIHCFTGDATDVRRYVDLGAFVSFSGIVSFGGAESLRLALALVPEDRLMIETDAPYLAPVPLRGQRNEPAFLPHTAQAVAKTLEIDTAEVARRTTANARRAYRLPAP